MEIRVPPEHLRGTAVHLERAAGEIDALLQAMLGIVTSLTAEWAGAASFEYIDRFQTQVPRMREQLASVLEGLVGSLRHIADEFERADHEAVRGIAGGTVLGVATAAPMAVLASAGAGAGLSERERLAQKMQLPGLLSSLEREQKRMQADMARIDQSLADIDRQIQDLQARRDALLRSQRWVDRILPDMQHPGLGFDDGIIDAPWRTRSDAQEDQIAEYERQIQALQQQRAEMLARREALQNALDQISERIARYQKALPIKSVEVQRWVELSEGRLPSAGEQCVHWARDRADTLGGPALPPIGNYPLGDLGAHQYLKIFDGRTFQIPADTHDLTQVEGLRPGTVLVWDAGHSDTQGTAGYTYGHVAVVESVQQDGVWVSQANWPGKPVMFISKDRLSTLHAIPPGAQPLSPEEVRRKFGR